MIMKGMVDMKYNIRGDKIVATKAIKDYVQDKLGRLDKYFKESDEYTANVLIRVKGHKQTIEVTVPTNKFILRSEVTDEDLYAAIDIVCDKLERQIRKNKTRLKKKSVLDNYKELNLNFDTEDSELDKEKIVKRKKIDTKPMNEEEAIIEMNLLGHDFFVFKNLDNEVCILYKRKDNKYGISETK